MALVLHVALSQFTGSLTSELHITNDSHRKYLVLLYVIVKNIISGLEGPTDLV